MDYSQQQQQQQQPAVVDAVAADGSEGGGCGGIAGPFYGCDGGGAESGSTGVDSVQSTITSTTAADLLLLGQTSCETLVTDDEMSSTATATAAAAGRGDGTLKHGVSLTPV